MKSFIKNVKKWNIKIFIRKSIFLLILIIFKISILLILEIIILYSIHLMINSLWKEFDLLFISLLYIWSITIYFIIIIWLTFYFYSVVIISDSKVYKLKLWLLFYEDIDVVELYRVQEIKAQKEWLFHVLLNIWNLHLVEQKDREKIIHFIDNPEKVEAILEKSKENIVYKRDIKN